MSMSEGSSHSYGGGSCGRKGDCGLELFKDVLSSATNFSRMSVVAEVQRPGAAGGAAPGVRQATNIISSIDFDMEDHLFATAGE